MFSLPIIIFKILFYLFNKIIHIIVYLKIYMLIAQKLKVYLGESKITMEQQLAKKVRLMLRIYDVIFSLGLIITLPILLLFYFLLSRRLFIFKQKRVGYKNKTFYLLKIRTMKTTTKNIPTHELNKKHFIFMVLF